MRYKHFTNANEDVSALAIGTWGTGELESFGYVEKEDGKITTKGIMKAREKAVEAIQAGLQGGVNLIDTAPCYGWGASERIVGEAIQDFDRDKILTRTYQLAKRQDTWFRHQATPIYVAPTVDAVRACWRTHGPVRVTFA